ncbi:MAG: hypothetical protein ACKOBM_01615 [Gammaproteobacteria bacterium]
MKHPRKGIWFLVLSGFAAPLSGVPERLLPVGVMAAAQEAQAAQAGTRLYRYRNAEGRVEISNAVPAARARFGYEVLDAASGRVIERVAPELSGAALERKLAEDQARADCAQRLAWIRATYRTIDALEAARRDTLSALDTRILHLEESRMRAEARLQALLEAQQKAAAPVARSDGAFTADLKSTLAAVETDIREQAAEVVERRADQVAANARFDADCALLLAGTCDAPADASPEDPRIDVNS